MTARPARPPVALRKLAIILLSLLCAGLVGYLWWATGTDGLSHEEAGGWLAAVLLAIREFISKIQDIVNGPREIVGGEE